MLYIYYHSDESNAPHDELRSADGPDGSAQVRRDHRSTPTTQAAQPGQRWPNGNLTVARGRLWLSRPQYYGFPASWTAWTGAGWR